MLLIGLKKSRPHWWDSCAIIGPSEEFLRLYKRSILLEAPYKFTTRDEAPVIYDVGSNIGLAILYYKHLYPRAKITAFEADPDVAAKYTRKNLEANHITDVNLVECAAWTEATTLTFYDNGKAAGSLAGKVDSQAGEKKIQAVRLRDYLEKETRIAFLKMDIEGAELPVIEDCKDQLHKIENLFVEYHGFKGKELECSRLLSLLESAGFRYQVRGTAKDFETASFLEAYENIDCIVEIFAKRISD